MQPMEMTDHERFGSDESSSVLEWRNELRTTVNTDDSGVFVVIEDPIAGKFFRIGQAEYRLTRLLDGQRSLSEVYAAFIRSTPDTPLAFDDVLTLARWLISNELAHTQRSKSAKRLQLSKTDWRRKQTLEQRNPLSIRLRLFSLDRLSLTLHRWFGFLFSPAITAVMAICMGMVFAFAAWNWESIRASAQLRMTAGTVFTFGFITIVLKVIHELSHGIVCRRYGGRVGSLGVLLILFVPLPFVDVSSVWRFRSRWQRVHVAIAGMFVELLIASVAIVVWMWVDDVTVRYICSCTVISAGLMTVLFNANPLMKFDGYYALTDALGWTDLYGDGQRYVSQLAQRCVYGDPIPPRFQSYWKRAFIASYGIASTIWRYAICVMILVASSRLFHGFGIVLTCIGIVLWLGLPAARCLTHFRKRPASQRARCISIGVGLVAFASLIAIFGSWPLTIKTPAIVQYSADDTIRSDVDGFIDQIHVQDGSVVKQGDLLITLSNPSLRLEAQQLGIEVDKSDLQTRKLLLEGKHAASQAEATRRQMLEKQRSELEQQIASLHLSSPHDGVVVARRLKESLGRYLRQGDEVMVVSQNDQKELRVLVPQDEIESLQTKLGRSVRYRTEGNSIESGTLTRINPRATEQCPYPAMLTVNGGALPIRSEQNTGPNEDEFSLTTPHFEAVVRLEPQASRRLHSGHRATVSLGANTTTLIQHIWDQTKTW